VSIGYGSLASVSRVTGRWRHDVQSRCALAIFISSNLLGSLVQIASLPVVILAPLGAVSLLWNAFFARLLLGDVFSPYMVFGTIAIAGGAVLIAVFGIVPEPTHSLESLLTLFARKVFIVYFTLLGAAVLVCLVVVSALLQWSLGTLPDTGDPDTSCRILF
jgi:magnesium transporter